MGQDVLQTATRDEASQSAKRYFSEATVDEAFEIVSRAGPISHLFAQIRSINDNIALEVVAITGSIIIDVTQTEERTKITSIRLSAIGSVYIEKTSEETSLHMQVYGSFGTYKISAKDPRRRQELVAFGESIISRMHREAQA